ncbi:CotY/CotZ family spore coat protein [Sporosarcina psychrophila]|uniref:Spore coat protein n=1 Tax=Sporosarcina psychrophila TaxID=1476 RepID=A0ABV2KG87_SPOPS
MINEGYGKKKEDVLVCCVKSTLKTIFETQNNAKLPIFKGILQETIPLILYSSATVEPYFACGITPTIQFPFRTCFFRIEDLTNSSVQLSLLRPLDVEGNCIDTIDNPYRLERTNIKVIKPIRFFCSIQCISPELVNRQIIIIGHKW